jgi:ribose transport system ATP-binding protein
MDRTAADTEATGHGLELDLLDVVKTFGATRALAGVSLGVRSGEIHGLIGHNGSGKSTLVKLLGGLYEPDEGTVALRGEPAFVHQTLGVVPGEAIVDNVRVGRYRRRWRGGPIDWKHEHGQAARALERFGVTCDPRAPVASLREAERALLAIARAVDQLGEEAGGLLVLDEPTVFLDKNSVGRLFEAMHVARGEGRAVLFVSHKLDEVRTICDRISVLREGRLVATVDAKDVSHDELIELMLGRSIAALTRTRTERVEGADVLSVEGLSGGSVTDLSFSVRRGEIVGLTGLVGSGFEDVPYLLYGSTRASSGTLRLGDEAIDVPAVTPRSAIASGVVLVPADRAGAGIVGTVSIRENMTLPKLDDFFRGGRLRHGAERSTAAGLVQTYGVKPANAEAAIGTLSGGNQQKALLGKWLQDGPAAALLHEPTQGVDLGARADIFALLRSVADAGCAVVVASSDEDCLAQLCDRVIIFHDGEATTEVVGEQVEAETIAALSYQAAPLKDPAG